MVDNWILEAWETFKKDDADTVIAVGATNAQLIFFQAVSAALDRWQALHQQEMSTLSHAHQEFVQDMIQRGLSGDPRVHALPERMAEISRGYFLHHGVRIVNAHFDWALDQDGQPLVNVQIQTEMPT